MRTINYQAFGNPSEVLFMTNTADPELKENEVKVRVHLSNITFADVMTVRGEYGTHFPLPASAGSEGVGVVEAVGSAIGTIRPGQRVAFCIPVGAWSDYVTIPESTAIVLPGEMSDTTAAQLYTNPMTAELMLKLTNVKEGDYILVNAANSSVGKLLIQFARIRGANIIAVTRKEDTVPLLLQLGALAVINSEKENLIARIREITNGTGIHVFFDALAGKLSSQVIQAMAKGGQVMCYGVLSRERIPLNVNQIIFKEITIKGFWLNEWVWHNIVNDRENYFRMRGELVQKMVTHNISMPVAGIYDLSDIGAAVTHFGMEGRSGKVLVSCI